MGQTPREIAQAETELRSRRWFDREWAVATLELPGFCMAQNLVTQADYQQFVAATGHRAPGISEADYQRQGFLVHPYARRAPLPLASQCAADCPATPSHSVGLLRYFLTTLERAIAVMNMISFSRLIVQFALPLI